MHIPGIWLRSGACSNPPVHYEGKCCRDKSRLRDKQINREDTIMEIYRNKNNLNNKIRRIAAVKSFQKRGHFCLSLSLRASMTVEAVLVIPLWVMAIMVLISIMILTGIKMRTRQAVCEGLRSVSSLPFSLERGGSALNMSAMKAVSLASLYRETKGELSGVGILDERVAGGSGGVLLIPEDFLSGGAAMSVKVVYNAKMPMAFFTGGLIPVEQKIKNYAWLGDEYMGGGHREKMVYITPHGSVYHEDINCTYLRPRVSVITVAQVPSKRNASGEKYRACEACVKYGISTGMSVFITDYGNRYHINGSCVKIKHDVISIPLSQAGGRHKCMKEEGKGLIKPK